MAIQRAFQPVAAMRVKTLPEDSSHKLS